MAFNDFHKSTENFFKKRKKEAIPILAISSFLLITVLLSLLFSFAEYGFDISLISRLSLNSLFDNFLSLFVSFGVMFFIPLILLLWAGGKTMFKSKATFVQVVYTWMISFSALVAIIIFLTAINMIYKPAAFLAYPLFIPLLYLLAVSTKTVHNISYGKAVLLIVFSNAAAGFVRLAFFMAYAVLFFNPDGISYSLNLTNNTDGTLTATYALIYKDSGDPKETCHVTLPQGWVPANEEMREKIQEKIDRDIPTSDAAFYKNDDEFLFFVYGLPRGGYSINPRLTCNFTTYSYYWFEKGFNPDNTTYKSEHLYVDENMLEACRYTAIDLNMKDERDIFGGNFAGNDLGFSGVYQSPVEEDQDLTFIINNIRCYTGSGG